MKKAIPRLLGMALLLTTAACVSSTGQDGGGADPAADAKPDTLLAEATPKPCPTDPALHGFEQTPIAWTIETFTDSQAITAISQSSRDHAKAGCAAMELSLEMIGGDPYKSKGEVFTDLRIIDPYDGIVEHVNMEGKTVTAWIFVPAAAAGDPQHPNGIQLYVKDNAWRAQYYTWFDLAGNTDRWVPVTFTPQRRDPIKGATDPGFSPGNISIIGIKIGTGTGSKAAYRGPIWVDSISW